MKSKAIRLLGITAIVLAIFQLGMFTGWTCNRPMTLAYEKLPVTVQRVVVSAKNLLIPVTHKRFVVAGDVPAYTIGHSGEEPPSSGIDYEFEHEHSYADIQRNSGTRFVWWKNSKQRQP